MQNKDIYHILKKQLDLDVDDSKVLIVGLGITGFSVAQYLRSNQFDFAIVDSRKEPELKQQLAEEMPEIAIFTGGFDHAAFTIATHMIVSPGVKLQEESIQQALAKGTKLISDIDLFACANSQHVVAITGSNGKSTVTTMLGEMAKAAGKKVAVGGNLGIPVLALLDAQTELYVLELSSFQLERTTQLEAVAATVLNITPDHMDRYKDLHEYAEIKRRIFHGSGVMIINLDDPLVADMRDSKRQTLTFSVHQSADFNVINDDEDYLAYQQQKLLAVSELKVSGQHNLANALAAIALAKTVGLTQDAICSALRQFTGLQHRMQQVAKIGGVNWVNDSKATNVGACIAALEGYQDKVILIAGGDAKGADMSTLVPVIKSKTKAVMLIGKDAGLIAQAINACVPVYAAETLSQAVSMAAELAQSGDNVLLSPACASLDQFKNYQQRGEVFCQAVKELAA
jgi:UDP-N-acetylmuramoylalanine--D-glutamate ligase